MTDQSQAPATAAEARAQIDALSANLEFGSKLLSGDVAATQQWNDLHSVIGKGGDEIENAMNGVVLGADSIPDGQSKLMAEGASWLRGLGMPDGVVREALEGAGVSKEEYRMVTDWRTRQMNDPAFAKRFLANEAEAVRLMMTASVVIAGGIKGEAKGF
ncbi:hypothetical protein FJN17_12215 [Bradyrhizobium symbiodeficiens]|uniref:DUF937 domain-containing protein n=1 Tax=Bradyrhizobium symbiodeficiens TaxID=1404367 RepID=A0ABX5W4Q7_9BRAD|nr:hypothetical protein [Bradyrhizobium symbiodeficiens]QDF38272.1 hypothetical protein FJN17_12215 [Bradyrhizobium symbiodeficiens]